MKRNITLLIIIGLLVFVALFLFLFSKGKYENNYFNRNVKVVSLKFINAKKFRNKSFGFIGSIDKNITIADFSNQVNLYKLNYNLNRIDTIKIPFPKEFDSKSYRIYKDILNDTIYSINIKGDISIYDRHKNDYYKLNGVQIDRLLTISSKSLIVRSINNIGGRQNREISKLSLSNQVSVIKKMEFPNLANSFFANDGVLQYDEDNKRILYMYYFKGEFLCLDTNLNILYKSKTIDTISIAQFKTKIIASKETDGKTYKQNTLAQPPKFVNIFICTNEKNVYVLSKLKADNQSADDFNDKQIIDVYDLNSGKYKDSFYIPKYKGLKLRQFLIKEKILVALFGEYIVTYEFNQSVIR